MKLTGEYNFDSPREAVWDALLDPDVLVKIMPGCEKLEKTGDNSYQGSMTIRVGPVQGRFQGKVELSDVLPCDSYHMKVDGQGPTGFMKGEGDIRLKESSPSDQVLLEYDFDAQVGGRLAGVGQRLLETTAKSVARRSLDTLNEIIVARKQGREADIQAPSAGRLAAGVAKDVVKDFFKRDKREKE